MTNRKDILIHNLVKIKMKLLTKQKNWGTSKTDK